MLLYGTINLISAQIKRISLYIILLLIERVDVLKYLNVSSANSKLHPSMMIKLFTVMYFSCLPLYRISMKYLRKEGIYL